MRDYRPYPYQILTRSNMRFFFSDPNRTSFKTPLAARQHYTVKSVLSALPPEDYELLKVLVPRQGSRKPDYYDAYIIDRMNERGMSEQEVKRVLLLLRQADFEIAVQMGYTDDFLPKKEVLNDDNGSSPFSSCTL